MNDRCVRRSCAVVAIVFLLVFATPAVEAETWTKQLARGVTLTQIVIGPSAPEDATPAMGSTPLEAEDTTPPMVINVLKIDPKVPGVRVQAVLGYDKVHGEGGDKGRETVGSMVKRVKAVAAVNADFFPWTGDPDNLHISGGELISEPHPRRTLFGMTSDGRFLFDRLEFDAKITLPDDKWFPIRGINRERKQNELVAYTSKYFSSTRTADNGSEAVITTEDLPVRIGVPIKGTVSKARPDVGDTPIPDGAIVLSGAGTGAKFVKEKLAEGTGVSIELNVKPSSTTGWEAVVEAVGGTPRMIRNGKIGLEVDEEGLKPGFYDRTHPRTAVGVTADGKLVLVTVDGRQSISVGIGLADLAKVMLSQGCVEALNLDGGGSSTMATPAGMLNSPSSGILRAVANGLAVLADDQPLETDGDLELGISPLNGPVESGTTAQLTLLDARTGEPLNADLANRAIWSTTGGMGFVDQSGRLYGIKARQGEAVVKLGAHVASVAVETIPGPPSKFIAKFEADPTGAPNRSTLAVSLTDLNGNPIKGQKVCIKVIAGVPDRPDALTGEDGRVSVGVTWGDTPGVKARAEVTLCILEPVTLERPE